MIVGIQVLLWSISGLYMTAIHIDIIHGDHLVKTPDSHLLSDNQIKPLDKDFLTALGVIKSIELKLVNSLPRYLIRTREKLIVIDALTLEPIPAVNEATIRNIANKIYAGKDSISNIEKLERYPDELGGRKQKIWKVTYDNWLNSTLYFTDDTGTLRGKRSDLWRLFDFFWMLHIMDYDSRSDVNNNLLTIAATVGALMALAGVGLLILSFNKSGIPGSSSRLLIIKKIHQWLGVFIGVQLFIWMLSGLVFNILPSKEVSGRYLIKRQADPEQWRVVSDFSLLIKQYPKITKITSGYFNNKPVFQLAGEKESFLVDASNFHKVDINKKLIESLLLERFKGKGDLTKLTLETERTVENRRYSLPVWRAFYSDSENSSLYVSAATGKLLGAITDTRRLFDFFWMLHIMDYGERSDMNNSLVIFAAVVNLFIAISGVWLLFLVFSLRDFNLLARFRRVPLILTSEQGVNREIFVKKNSQLFYALAQEGYFLPSSCGGGGSCGLCKVKADESSPVSDADKSCLSSDEIHQGYRLACQLSLSRGLRVELPATVSQDAIICCKVISNQFKTPLIKELVLALPDDQIFEFKAGEYVLLHLPLGRTHLAEIPLNEVSERYWQEHNIAQYSSFRSEPVSRSYSMANPPCENRHIVLNIRLALPAEKGGESGKGSSYLFSLAAGEEVRITGSFGHFHSLENQNEMVFIGGGAGMAPLRSHILHQLETLKTNRKISFWFGARNQEDIFYQKTFNRLAKEHSNFEWHIALSHKNEAERWDGFCGMIDQVVKENYLEYQQSLQNIDFYICGPEAMNKAVIKQLKNAGVNSQQLHLDEFGY